VAGIPPLVGVVQRPRSNAVSRPETERSLNRLQGPATRRGLSVSSKEAVYCYRCRGVTAERTIDGDGLAYL
jgi:hypothetical protein